MNTDLITRGQDLAITFNEAAHELKRAALMLSVEIETVNSPETQAVAVQAQQALHEVCQLVEKSRVAVKAPVLECGRQIDKAATEFVANLRKETMRVSKLVGDYQEGILAQQRSAEAAQRAELARIEREREAELAKVSTIVEREAIHARAAAQVEAMPRPIVAPKVEGQIVKEDWEFEVTDVWLLCKMHPNLVKIEPLRQAIKDELKLGHKIHGIAAQKVVKASVRAGKVNELAVSAI